MDASSKTSRTVLAPTVVTGGASGIGLATVREMLRRGHNVVIADANEASLAHASSELAGHPEATCFIHCDVTDETQVNDLFERVHQRFGPVAGLVQSAGIGVESAFFETSVATFRKILDVNLLGSFIIGRAAARQMRARGGGAIVNVASTSGLIGNAGRCAYGASKGGVVTLTKVMAVELAEYGIRVNAVAPGAIDTPLVKTMHSPQTRESLLARIPQRRYGTPEEIASLIAALLDDSQTGYCTGQVIAIDGGMTAVGLMAARPVSSSLTQTNT